MLSQKIPAVLVLFDFNTCSGALLFGNLFPPAGLSCVMYYQPLQPVLTSLRHLIHLCVCVCPAEVMIISSSALMADPQLIKISLVASTGQLIMISKNTEKEEVGKEVW